MKYTTYSKYTSIHQLVNLLKYNIYSKHIRLTMYKQTDWFSDSHHNTYSWLWVNKNTSRKVQYLYVYLNIIWFIYIVCFLQVLLYLLLIHASLLQVFVTNNSSWEAPHKQEVELAAGVYHITWTHHWFRHQFLLSNLQGTHHITQNSNWSLKKLQNCQLFSSWWPFNLYMCMDFSLPLTSILQCHWWSLQPTSGLHPE